MDTQKWQHLQALLGQAHEQVARGCPREALAAVMEAARLSGAHLGAFPDLQRALDRSGGPDEADDLSRAMAQVTLQCTQQQVRAHGGSIQGGAFKGLQSR